MNISIIGGGIGGLATANALYNNGFNMQVFEKAQVLQLIGAGLSFAIAHPYSTGARGSVTLMGDAAHPVTLSLRQGANMAFEDADELAECLSAEPNVEIALNAYDKSRIPRTTAIYDRSTAQNYCSYQSDRETLFRGMNPSKVSQDEFETWLYSYSPSIANYIF